MLSVIIQALNKSVLFLCTPFANRCLIFSDWTFEITLKSTSGRRDDSPDMTWLGFGTDSSPVVSLSLSLLSGARGVVGRRKAREGRQSCSLSFPSPPAPAARVTRRRLGTRQDSGSVRNKEIKFIWIYSLGRDLMSVIRVRESVLNRFF